MRYLKHFYLLGRINYTCVLVCTKYNCTHYYFIQLHTIYTQFHSDFILLLLSFYNYTAHTVLPIRANVRFLQNYTNPRSLMA